MATVRISQLTAITTPTDDDVLIINDADTNTRKITFGNLTAGLLSTSGTAQTKSGALTVGSTLTAGSLVVDTDTLFVDATTNRVGIGTATPGEDLDVDGNVRVRNQGVVQLGDSNNSNYVGLRSPSAIATDFTLTLPNALPTQGNFITYDASGLGSFAAETAFASNELRAPYVGARGVGSNVGEVRLYELPTNGGEYITLQAPSNLAATIYYTLPGTYPGSNGFVLASDTSGTLSWVSNGAAAAGSPGYVQFNTGGSLDADSTFTFNAATNTLSAENIDIGMDLGIAGDLQVTGDVQFGKTITAGGTTGAQTINKTAGSVNFAAAATSLVVTNNLVTTDSVIVATVATNDSTMKSVQVVAGSGSFTIYANAAATAETRVNFVVIN